jgi:accessory gene regulator B
MVETLALRIAEAIKRVEPDKTASVQVMKYSLEALLQTLFTFMFIGIIGLLTGAFGETMIGAFSFIILRYFSGGLHLRKAATCSLVSILLISIAPHFPLTERWVIIFGGISLILILLFAPSNIEGHARIPRKYFPALKLISALIVSSNFIFLESSIAMVFFFQAVTTIQLRKGANL